MKKGFVWICLTIGLVFVASMTRGAWAAETKISIDPTQVRDVATGETFTVNVTVTDVVNLYGWQINVSFNPDVLSVSKVAEGSFLKNVNKTVWLTPKIENDKGLLLAGTTFNVPFPPSGASGSGILANITFTVKSGGSSTLHFEAGTKLNSIQANNLIPIENFTKQDGSFGAAGGIGGLPFEYIIGVAVVVVIVVVAGALYLKRRKK